MFPVSLVILFLAVCGFFIISSVRENFGNVFGAFASIGILLLVPLSLLVFRSVRTNEKVRLVSFYITMISSIIALMGLFTLPLFFTYSHGIFVARVADIMELFLVFGFPVIGICYIACGVFAGEQIIFH